MKFITSDRKLKFTGLLLILVGLVFIAPDANRTILSVYGEFNEDKFFDELKECTTGLASIYATPDGRPLLWKDRDLGGGVQQEYHYVDDGRIPFISQCYSNDTDEYYGGINAVGFAVENSNSYNIRDSEGGYDDDGYIMYLALATCRTVEDFARILDSTNVAGRSLNCNYGTFDAFGGAIMFETGAHTYAAVDAAEEPEGFVVRSNYSYSGYGLEARQMDWGPNRHDRSMEGWKAAAEEGNLTPQYLYKHVVRSLEMEGMDSYSIPYEGYVEGYPYGCIPNGEVVCRLTTRAVMIAQGARPNESPDDAMMWIMAGNSLGSIVTPLWVRAGSVPSENDAPSGSRACNRAQQIREWIYEGGGGGVNTFKLRNESGTGFWDYAIPLEDMVFNKVHRFLRSPNFHYDRLEAFQNEMAQQIADSLEAWHPTYQMSEITEPVYAGNNLVLAWDEVDRDPAGGEQIDPPMDYSIYRSSQPFREGDGGELIAVVESNRFVDENPLDGAGFYRVVARY